MNVWIRRELTRLHPREEKRLNNDGVAFCISVLSSSSSFISENATTLGLKDWREEGGRGREEEETLRESQVEGSKSKL